MTRTKVKTFTFNSVAENTYILYNSTGEAAIIDCGCMDRREEEELLRFVEAEQLNVQLLLNTHLHFDHAWGNGFAAKAFELPVRAHRAEVEEMPSPAVQLGAFGMGGTMDEPEVQYIEAGDVLTLGDVTIQALFVPGHSPGHLAFYCPQAGAVFTGDALFAGDVGRTDLWGGSYERLKKSIRTELLPLPDDTVVYPGHGPTSTIGYERSNNPYLD